MCLTVMLLIDCYSFLPLRYLFPGTWCPLAMDVIRAWRTPNSLLARDACLPFTWSMVGAHLTAWNPYKQFSVTIYIFLDTRRVIFSPQSVWGQFYLCSFYRIFFIVYPIKDGLSTDVKSESFDDEAFETGNKNEFLVHDIYKSCAHVLMYWIFYRFFQSVFAVLYTGV